MTNKLTGLWPAIKQTERGYIGQVVHMDKGVRQWEQDCPMTRSSQALALDDAIEEVAHIELAIDNMHILSL